MRVFLSHTSELRRLPNEGSFVAAAEAAISQTGHAISDMKYWTAQPEPPAKVCVEAIASSDVYVGIIGFFYGSLVPDRPDVSYTELEYETAVQRGLPCYIFLLSADAHGPAALFLDPENGERQRTFRERVMHSGVTLKAVASPLELQALLVLSLTQLSLVGSESDTPPLISETGLGRSTPLEALREELAALETAGHILAKEGLSARSRELRSDAAWIVANRDTAGEVGDVLREILLKAQVDIIMAAANALDAVNRISDSHRRAYVDLMDQQYCRIDLLRDDAALCADLEGRTELAIDRFFDDVDRFIGYIASRVMSIAQATNELDRFAEDSADPGSTDERPAD